MPQRTYEWPKIKISFSYICRSITSLTRNNSWQSLAFDLVRIFMSTTSFNFFWKIMKFVVEIIIINHCFSRWKIRSFLNINQKFLKPEICFVNKIAMYMRNNQINTFVEPNIDAKIFDIEIFVFLMMQLANAQWGAISMSSELCLNKWQSIWSQLEWIHVLCEPERRINLWKYQINPKSNTHILMLTDVFSV